MSDAARLPRVVICHPGRQHSYQLATALADAGMLARYVTGVPTHAGAGGWPLSRFLRQTAADYQISLDPALVRHLFVSPLVRRATARVLSGRSAVAWSHRGDNLFDWLVSKQLGRSGADVVVAYENSALQTFRAARRLGICTVLDAASFHHAWQDRFYQPRESARAHRRIVRRKEEELKLAERVLCTSEMAKASYLEAGVPAAKLQTIAMGVDLKNFEASIPAERKGERAAGIRFVFVGAITALKGMPELYRAAQQLERTGQEFQLTLVGSPAPADCWSTLKNLRRVGRLPHDELPAELRAHDVLVLPSRFDSFGMVVAEAMACGLPAIVTENVGAKEMVTPGVDGLVIPAGDSAALAGAMQWFIDHRGELPAMARAARASAERYDWSNYRRRAVEFFSGLGRNDGRG